MCHGIDSLATLMLVFSEVADVGLRPCVVQSASASRGGGLVRTKVESSETESAGHYSEENLRMSVNCGREREGYIRRARDPASRPASAWFFQLARQTLVEGFLWIGGEGVFVSLVDIGFLLDIWGAGSGFLQVRFEDGDVSIIGLWLVRNCGVSTQRDAETPH